MPLHASDYLDVKSAAKYAFIAVKYDGYRLWHFGDSPDVAFVGVQCGHNMGEDELTDAIAAYKRLTAQTPTKGFFGTPVRYAHARQLWADCCELRVEKVVLHDHKLLIELLDLCESHEHLFVDVTRAHEAMSLLLPFCAKHGLPYYTDEKEPSECPDNPFFSRPAYMHPPERWLHYGFYVHKFLCSLEELYCLYLLWKAAFYNDWAAMQAFDTITEGKYRIAPAGALNAYLAALSWSSKVSRELEFEDKRGHFTIVSLHMIDALKQQMLDVFALGEDGLDGKSLFQCIRCNTAFIRSHGNAKLCDHCKKNAEVIRAHRMRKRHEKEAANHAKESKQ